jgi:hypothetical protein
MTRHCVKTDSHVQNDMNNDQYRYWKTRIDCGSLACILEMRATGTSPLFAGSVYCCTLLELKAGSGGSEFHLLDAQAIPVSFGQLQPISSVFVFFVRSSL